MAKRAKKARLSTCVGAMVWAPGIMVGFAGAGAAWERRRREEAVRRWRRGHGREVKEGILWGTTLRRCCSRDDS